MADARLPGPPPGPASPTFPDQHIRPNKQLHPHPPHSVVRPSPSSIARGPPPGPPPQPKIEVIIDRATFNDPVEGSRLADTRFSPTSIKSNNGEAKKDKYTTALENYDRFGSPSPPYPVRAFPEFPGPEEPKGLVIAYPESAGSSPAISS
jgi:hypothetical protein